MNEVVAPITVSVALSDFALSSIERMQKIEELTEGDGACMQFINCLAFIPGRRS